MKLYIFLALYGLCTVTQGTGRHGARRASNTMVAQLRELINEENALKDRLHNRVAALRQEADKLNSSFAPCVCPTAIPRKPPGPSIAYTGTLPAYVSSLKSSTTLSYKNDLINVGQPFNVTSGHFVANVSGLYGFSMSVFMQPSYWTDMELVKNGSPFLYARTGHYKTTKLDRQVNMATNFAVEMLNDGDEVWPRYKSSSSTNLYADGVTTFSGVLLREM